MHEQFVQEGRDKEYAKRLSSSFALEEAALAAQKAKRAAAQKAKRLAKLYALEETKRVAAEEARVAADIKVVPSRMGAVAPPSPVSRPCASSSP